MKKEFAKFCLAQFFLLIIYFFSACTGNAPAKKMAVAMPGEKVIITGVNDSTKAQACITEFLQWYKTNYKKANSFPLLIKDGAGNFVVNRTAYIDYLNFLSSSKLLSPRYIGYWKTFFTDKEIELKKNKMKSDIPDGFDMDLVLITQEPEIILNKIDSIRFNISSMNDSVALVGLKLPHDSIDYEIEMYKTNHNWQIGYIATPNYD